jgi:hypothetical protein
MVASRFASLCYLCNNWFDAGASLPPDLHHAIGPWLGLADGEVPSERYPLLFRTDQAVMIPFRNFDVFAADIA